MFDESFWEERYRSRTAVWSGRPNPQLVAEAADLTPGTALDAGCGEGADAIWLADRGWQVTGVDFAETALRRAAAQPGGDRVRWQQADLLTWTPDRSYDLVSAQYLHLPDQHALFTRLAGAVAPGGRLLIVGHHRSDLETTVGRPNLPDLLHTAEELATVVDEGWDVVAEDRPRTAVDPDGNEVTIHDAVLVAIRR
ncbi:class I SAM-dependent methyltransferase [Actinokineospora sp. NPDC004072]